MLGLLYFPRQSVFTPAVAKEEDVHGVCALHFKHPRRSIYVSGYQLSLAIRTTGNGCMGGELPAKAGIQNDS